MFGDVPAYTPTVSDVQEAFDKPLHPQCNGPMGATAPEVKLLDCPKFA